MLLHLAFRLSGVLRTLCKIYDGAFMRKQLLVFGSQRFSQKASIKMFERVLDISLWLGCMCVKFLLKVIIHPKNQFFMESNLYIILIYWSSPSIYFQKASRYFLEIIEKIGHNKNAILLLTFFSFLQAIQLSENVCSHTTSQTL